MRIFANIKKLLPGFVAIVPVAFAAFGLEWFEQRLFNVIWIDSLVLAIVLGIAARAIMGLPKAADHGVTFASKTVLEIAIVCLGASVSAGTIFRSGLYVPCAVVAIVFLSLAISYTISRMLGLTRRMATLVACGNSICGNSAIAATAPVIGAEADEVAAAISFTAALGVVVVVALPHLTRILGLSEWQYGIVAGMTVYAVPQVLAATVPVGVLSSQVGTLVKLLRVLMLGPVLLLLGLVAGQGGSRAKRVAAMAPWFIIGFLTTMTFRSTGLIPDEALPPLASITTVLTIVSMAALGLSVDLATVIAAGGRVLAAAMLSITTLGALTLTALSLFPRGI